MTPPNRREFISAGALAISLVAFPRLGSANSSQAAATPKLNVFSKHLQFLDYQELARTAKALGFGGIDLTVRPQGHVSPENVETDLPRAVEAIRSEGLEIPMITTAVKDANDPLDRKVLEQAAKHGIKRYRMNWFRYDPALSMPDSLAACQQRIQKLDTLNKELGLVGCYQNHAGTLVGASLWEVWQLLQGSSPSTSGAQYDIRHATVEGGRSWTNGFQLVKSRIKTIALKDFRWIRRDGRSEIENTPIGTGMVDFPRYFKMLKQDDIDVPISMHFEYELGGAESGKRKISRSHDSVFEAMRGDIASFKRLWQEA